MENGTETLKMVKKRNWKRNRKLKTNLKNETGSLNTLLFYSQIYDLRLFDFFVIKIKYDDDIT